MTERDAIIKFLQWLTESDWSYKKGDLWENRHEVVDNAQLVGKYIFNNNNKKYVEYDYFSRVEKVAKHLDNYPDYSHTPKVKELAKIAVMGASHFKAQFKRFYGVGVLEYYLNIKMKKAKEYIDTGIYDMKEVSVLVGYCNLNYFFRAYEKHYKEHPMDATPQYLIIYEQSKGANIEHGESINESPSFEKRKLQNA